MNLFHQTISMKSIGNLTEFVREHMQVTKRADKLTQAILAKAFRGELVPTEAELARKEGRDYEPASVLL
jgi:type I restriction enzyme S subunit